MNLTKILLTSLLLCSFTMTASAAVYERTYGKIDYIYLFDNATNQFGIRIVLKDPVVGNAGGYECSEWYLQLGSELKNQMYAMALAAEAQDKEITLMLRDTAENISGTTICAVHRMYSKKKL